MNYNKATFDRAFGISAQLPPADGIEIAFAGRSNVKAHCSTACLTASLWPGSVPYPVRR